MCSGGADLCLWDRRGKMLSKFCREELEERSELFDIGEG